MELGKSYPTQQGGPTEFYTGNESIAYAVLSRNVILKIEREEISQTALKYFNFRSKIQLDHPVDVQFEIS